MEPVAEPLQQSYREIFKDIAKNLEAGTTRGFAFVTMMLKSMLLGAKKLETQFLTAMHDDIRSDEALSYLMALHPFKQELGLAIEKLRKW